MQKVLSYIRRAVEEYNMIEEGDCIAVGLSGGKDSTVLLCALAQFKYFSPVNFTLKAIAADPCFNNQPTDYSQLAELCRRLGVPFTVKRTELYEIIFNIRKEKCPCSLCARMRRGILHDMCKELGCNKLALGHHMDDAVETFFMNLLNGGSISSFSPVTYLSRKDLHLIRPMIYAREKDMFRVANALNLPIVKSKCPADGNTEREEMKQLISELSVKYKKLPQKIVTAMKNGEISGW